MTAARTLALWNAFTPTPTSGACARPWLTAVAVWGSPPAAVFCMPSVVTRPQPSTRPTVAMTLWKGWHVTSPLHLRLVCVFIYIFIYCLLPSQFGVLQQPAHDVNHYAVLCWCRSWHGVDWGRWRMGDTSGSDSCCLEKRISRIDQINLSSRIDHATGPSSSVVWLS